ncbi:hypothetical protein [Altererythrobacter sp. C41]|uniref:hypothetical protein n=1 Tax=Altererythrobacter sp. C41 TaxID=2806021 RepID=UPI0019314BF8|nr:hypothetical protein [Altererythrobacter sp. C41]MBM0170851.1 hypothetical protein [Altererythrobacter sp. C41]
MNHETFLALPADVVRFAWSAPMRELAVKVGISDVGLRKLLVSEGVPIPPQGHWNRVHAGRKVGPPPHAKPRGPGESGRIRLDHRFRDLVPEAGPIPEEGPFASAAVPEDLADLRALELKSIGRVAASRDLERAHPALRQLLKREAQLREKHSVSNYSWDRPNWDGPLAQRQLRIINGLFKTLSKRGHAPWTRYSQGELQMYVSIGTRHFQLRFGGSGHRGGERAPSRDLPANTKLTLSVDHKSRSALITSWMDGDQQLEQQIASIAADLIVVGEEAFRQGLVEQREWEEQRRRWADEASRAELQRLQEKRLTDLEESGTLLHKAAEIRALVGQVGAAVENGNLAVTPEQLARWKTWALAQADKLDPVLTGQVLSHLVVPQLDDA